MSDTSPITITRESPLSPELSLLMARHKAAMHAETPPESIHMMEAAELAAADVDFFVMRDGARPVGMGAYKRIDPAHAEIKSMHVLAEERGRGLARVMLDHLTAAAAASGITRLSLETGAEPGFAPARALYERAGFGYCGPFEGYGPDPNSVFMTRAL